MADTTDLGHGKKGVENQQYWLTIQAKVKQIIEVGAISMLC